MTDAPRSIINGFAIPLKKEHIQFLEKALIPLHKPRGTPYPNPDPNLPFSLTETDACTPGVAIYHPQLSYCISQYVEKDPETIVPIINGLVRYWPWSDRESEHSCLR